LVTRRCLGPRPLSTPFSSRFNPSSLSCRLRDSAEFIHEVPENLVDHDGKGSLQRSNVRPGPGGRQTGDIVSKAKRSEIMKTVGQRDTVAERAVRGVLRENGVHYIQNHPRLPGRPDFANRTGGWAIFVHGCFWHGHLNCKKTKSGKTARVPLSNASFWSNKILENQRRDRRKAAQLRRIGIRVVTVWECELGTGMRLQRKLFRFLDLNP